MQGKIVTLYCKYEFPIIGQFFYSTSSFILSSIPLLFISLSIIRHMTHKRVLRFHVFQKLNCTEQDVIAALEVHDPKNQYRIAYNLILDSKTNRHIGNFTFQSASFYFGISYYFSSQENDMAVLC